MKPFVSLNQDSYLEFLFRALSDSKSELFATLERGLDYIEHFSHLCLIEIMRIFLMPPSEFMFIFIIQFMRHLVSGCYIFLS